MNPKAAGDRWPSREPGTRGTGPAGVLTGQQVAWGRSLGDNDVVHHGKLGGGHKIKRNFQTQTWQVHGAEGTRGRRQVMTCC